MHTQNAFLLRAAAQGLVDRNVTLVLSTGGTRDPATIDLGVQGPNLRLERWVAHSDLLPHTDVLVTTGGAGTVMAALAAGVPQLIIPTEWDKPENARRIVAAGVGLAIAPHRLTPIRLRRAVARLIIDPEYRRNAERLRAVLARNHGPLRAAELLERLCIGAQAGQQLNPGFLTNSRQQWSVGGGVPWPE